MMVGSTRSIHGVSQMPPLEKMRCMSTHRCTAFSIGAIAYPSRDQREVLARSQAAVGIDRPVGEQKLSAFAPPHHGLDRVEEEGGCGLRRAKLAGRFQIVPGNAEGAFQNLWCRFGHRRQTLFADIAFRRRNRISGYT